MKHDNLKVWLVGKSLKRGINKNFALYFTYLPRSLPWGNFHQILHSCRSRGRNHLWQIFWWLIKGRRFYGGSKWRVPNGCWDSADTTAQWVITSLNINEQWSKPTDHCNKLNNYTVSWNKEKWVQILGRALSGNNLRQVVHTHLPSRSQWPSGSTRGCSVRDHLLCACHDSYCDMHNDDTQASKVNVMRLSHWSLSVSGMYM